MLLLIKAFILGIIEGLTEFLPVSSTGHLILAGHVLKFEGNVADTFEVVIQLGAILAICFIYKQKIISLFNLSTLKKHNQLNLYHIGFGIVPALFIGFIFHGLIKSMFSPKVVIIGLILGAILMLYAEKSRKTFSTTTLDKLSYRQAFAIGLFQCLAVIPGFSRAGSTMAGGLLAGVDHKTSAEFSFIIAIPMMVAASGYDLLKSYQFLHTSDLPLFSVGFITAFVVAIIAVVTFLKLLERVKLSPFAYYRIILAIIFTIIIF